ncbi:MAG: DUF3267 domain-containing protein [Clostridia bacterium]|nr:DUF3267 domain-containing protein [Clostridia bacterium]
MWLLFGNIILQIGFFIGAVYLVGFLISLLNRVFYGLVEHSQAVCYATGFIGTPIHELSHALMCVVFRHKIDEIKLFQIDDENGVLGYVRHSYNPKSIYQRVGNYFISVAPIVCGTAVLFLLIKLLLPQTFTMMAAYVSAYAGKAAIGLNMQNVSFLIGAFQGMATTLLYAYNSGWQFWAFVVLALCIALHQNMSGADIKNSLSALPILIILLAIVNIALYFIVPATYLSFIAAMNTAGGFLVCGLLLALVCSLIPLSVAFLFSLLKKVVRRGR